MQSKPQSKSQSKQYSSMLRRFSDRRSSRLKYYDFGNPAEAANPAVSAQKGKLTIGKRIRRRLLVSDNIYYIDLLNAVLSVASTLLYISETFFREYHYYFDKIDLFMCILFGADYFFQLLIAPSKFDQVFSFDSIVDVVTIVPIFFTYGAPVLYTYHVQYYILFIEMIRVARLLRLLRVRRLIDHIDIETKREILKIFIWSLTIVQVTAELFRIVENIYLEKNWEPPLDFTDAFYFIVVTLTTVGYGDISPSSPLGRILIVIFILTEIYLVPKTVNNLIKLFAKKTIYERNIFKPTRDQKHVIISGDFDDNGILGFLQELFHEDHGNLNIAAVILQNRAPSKKLVEMLNAYSYNVEYLTGDPLHEKDLQRAAAVTSSAVFLLANNYSDDPENVDTTTILRALSIKNYVQAEGKDVKVLLQLIKTESMAHLKISYSKLLMSSINDHQICIGKIKMSLVAKSCLCPGFVTMIGNLISSQAETIPISKAPWVKEFKAGCDFEIYHTKLSGAFAGLTFSEVAYLVYECLEVTVFALDIRPFSPDPNPPTTTILNPGSFIIPEEVSCIVNVFVIAPDKASSDLSNIKSVNIDPSGSVRSPCSEKIGKSRLEQRLAMYRQNKGSTSFSFARPAMGAREKQNEIEAKEVEEEEVKPTKIKEVGKNWKKIRAAKEGFGIESYDSTLMHYQLLSESVELEAVTIQTSISEEFPHVKKHIVITGCIQNIFHLIKPLRAGYLGRVQPIVILHPTFPTFETWQKINMFPEIYFVEGSGLDSVDLFRAGVQNAAKAIVFSRSADNINTKNPDYELLDADTIFTHQGLKRMNPDIQIIAEFIDMRNTEFLIDATHTSAQQYASGKLYNASMLDMLLCQLFYNPKMNKCLEILVSGSAQQARATEKWNNRYGQLHGKLINSHLYQIQVPKEFLGRSYMEIFEYLTQKQHTIPIGLYRGPALHSRLASTGNSMPYVYTNPPTNTDLNVNDCIFVLAQSPPENQSGSEEVQPRLTSKNRSSLLKANENVFDAKMIEEIKRIEQRFLAQIRETREMFEGTKKPSS